MHIGMIFGTCQRVIRQECDSSDSAHNRLVISDFGGVKQHRRHHPAIENFHHPRQFWPKTGTPIWRLCVPYQLWFSIMPLFIATLHLASCSARASKNNNSTPSSWPNTAYRTWSHLGAFQVGHVYPPRTRSESWLIVISNRPFSHEAMPVGVGNGPASLNRRVLSDLMALSSRPISIWGCAQW